MLGRQVTAALRRPLQARLRTAITVQPQYNLCIRTFSHVPRQLSPAGRPKKAVGEPSNPVKRAVKKTAKKPASSKTDAAAKKLAQKKKLAEKKAAAAKKAKAKRVLTPEQVEKKKAALQKAELKDLKKAALEPPVTVGRASAYLEFVKEQSRDWVKSSPSSTGLTSKQALAEYSKGVAAAWKQLSPADIEHYNHLAHTRKEATQAEYKRWVETHSAEEIAIANTARRALRRRLPTKKGNSSKWPNIEDERQVKRATTPWILFYISRQNSGDFKNIPVFERSKLISKEWRSLDEAEKKKFQDLYDQDASRYASEYKSVFGHSPTQATAAAAA